MGRGADNRDELSFGSFVRIAVIEPLKCCAPLAMSASGKLHCGVATIRQWLVWAVRFVKKRLAAAALILS